MTIRQYFVNSPAVVGEVIDDEAVIIDLQSGRYFNTQASGALIWTGIEQGATIEALTARLVARFDIDPVEAAEQAMAFVAVLEGHGLVRAEAPAMPAVVIEEPRGSEAFAVPQLGIHSDLDDLLRLDPIHDVDAAGWPMAQRQA